MENFIKSSGRYEFGQCKVCGAKATGIHYGQGNQY